MRDGEVVCRQLGYTNVSTTYCCSNFGSSNYTLTWLSNLYCTGNESKVSDCQRGYGWGNINNGCNRYSVAGVRCTGNRIE